MLVNVVVGAGQAGAHAAVAMRRAGFGGRIVLIGDESAIPYERPPLSKAFIASEDEVPLVHFFEPATFAAESVEVITGVRAEAIDLAAGRLELGFGGTMPFDKLVLATGSRARRLSLPGAELSHTLRTYGDAMRLRAGMSRGKRVVCIGAGVIGLELAASARARGCEVTVVDVAASVLSRSLDPRLAELLIELHERNGVEFVLSATVEAIDRDGVVLGGGRTIPADIVIAGIGVERNIGLALQAGIRTRRGILVDASGVTSAPNVLAAGEVAEFHSRRLGGHTLLESWRHAQDHGALVGRVAAGAAEEYHEVPWFWSDQYGINLQFAGDTSGNGTHTIDRGERGSESFTTFFLDAGGSVVGALGCNAPKEVAAALRMIRSRLAVPRDLLADPATSMQRLVSQASRLALT